MTQRRTPVAARTAMREAIARALAAELTPTDTRVLLALLQLVTLYDRTEDRVANRQIVEATGLDQRHVRRSLQHLADVGVIEREAGHSRAGGPRVASLIRFPTGGDTRPPNRGRDLPPVPGADSRTDRGQIPAVTGGGYAPASEDLSEDLSARAEGPWVLDEHNVAHRVQLPPALRGGQ